MTYRGPERLHQAPEQSLTASFKAAAPIPILFPCCILLYAVEGVVCARPAAFCDALHKGALQPSSSCLPAPVVFACHAGRALQPSSLPQHTAWIIMMSHLCLCANAAVSTVACVRVRQNLPRRGGGTTPLHIESMLQQMMPPIWAFVTNGHSCHLPPTLPL